MPSRSGLLHTPQMLPFRCGSNGTRRNSERPTNGKRSTPRQRRRFLARSAAGNHDRVTGTPHVSAIEPLFPFWLGPFGHGPMVRPDLYNLRLLRPVGRQTLRRRARGGRPPESVMSPAPAGLGRRLELLFDSPLCPDHGFPFVGYVVVKEAFGQLLELRAFIASLWRNSGWELSCREVQVRDCSSIHLVRTTRTSSSKGCGFESWRRRRNSACDE